MRFLNKIDSYRFSKFYTVPQFEAFIKTVGDSKSINQSTLITLLKTKFPNSSMIFVESEHKSGMFEIFTLGPFPYSNFAEPYACLQKHIMQFLHKYIMKHVSLEFFTDQKIPVIFEVPHSMQSHIRSSRKTEKEIRMFNIPFHGLANSSDASELLEKVIEGAYEIEQAIIKYRKIIDDEEKKALIFS